MCQPWRTGWTWSESFTYMDYRRIRKQNWQCRWAIRNIRWLFYQGVICCTCLVDITFTGCQYSFLQVQLQTLTALVKLFLQKPDSSQGVVQHVLNTATKDRDSPDCDVHDRAYIYWRLLSTDPGAAQVYFFDCISPDLSHLMTFDRLLCWLFGLRSHYHKQQSRPLYLKNFWVKYQVWHKCMWL